MKRLAIGALAILWGACAVQEQAEPARPAIAIEVEPATIHTVRGSFEAGGVIAARTTAAIASRLTATVVAVDVQPGVRVRAGQRLIALDGRDLDARRAAADASAAALDRALAGGQANRAAAESALTLARVSHRRIAALHARASATAQELDESSAQQDAAEAHVRAAEARVAELEAARTSARAAATEAGVAATFTVLAAPFDGIVTERLVDPGNLAVAGVPLLRMDDARAFRLEVRVDESRADVLQVGDRVDVFGTASGAAPWFAGARVAEIARAVDASSHALLVKIDLPGGASDLRSGVFARARFDRGRREALMVPASAIVPQGQLSTLFVVGPQARARMRVVRTGASQDGRVEIIAGLALDEPVIVAPPAALRDGDPVRVDTGVNAAPAGAP